jgi:hypothetical protein
LAKEGSVSHETNFSKWSHLIGSAVLNFGEIELATLTLLAHMERAGFGKSKIGEPFSARVDRIVKILDEWNLPAGESQAMKEQLLRAQKLAVYRNTIAHNPIQLDFYQNLATGDVTTEAAIRDFRNEKRVIDLESLEEYVAEVSDTSSSLYMSLGKLIEALDSRSETDAN